MKQYRTAQGKTIDMGALAAKNERTRAVGNMSVNARGDTVDDHGRIIVPVTQKVGEKYQKTVGNKTAQVRKSKSPQKIAEQLTPEELDLESALDEDIEIEKIKAKEMGKK
jgi:hypothetical protein